MGLLVENPVDHASEGLQIQIHEEWRVRTLQGFQEGVEQRSRVTRATSHVSQAEIHAAHCGQTACSNASGKEGCDHRRSRGKLHDNVKKCCVGQPSGKTHLLERAPHLRDGLCGQLLSSIHKQLCDSLRLIQQCVAHLPRSEDLYGLPPQKSVTAQKCLDSVKHQVVHPSRLRTPAPLLSISAQLLGTAKGTASEKLVCCQEFRIGGKSGPEKRTADRSLVDLRGHPAALHANWAFPTESCLCRQPVVFGCWRGRPQKTSGRTAPGSRGRRHVYAFFIQRWIVPMGRAVALSFLLRLPWVGASRQGRKRRQQRHLKCRHRQ
mmetsp:Transcript_3928/g.10892  ORF Transcript_3928/g.10892 Transcript_3928/m.10892 type:complete len:321 (+) Transcript_3928:2334-3296(+)